VVAIITLLISILVPAVNAARKQAARAAARAQISGVSSGIEMFRTDFGYYPSSVPQDKDGVNAPDIRTGADGDDFVVQGAHRLAMAMVGLDQLGCPAKNGGKTTGGASVSPDSIKGWYYSQGASGSANGSFASNATAIYPKDTDWGNPVLKTTRRGPYIDPKGFNIVKDMTIDDRNPGAIVLTDRYDKRAQDNITTSPNSGYDAHSVILYYAANERGKYIYRGAIDENDPNNIYYYQDNKNILSSASSFIGGSYTAQKFYDFIEDTNAQINTGNNATHMPVNKDSFILISRGWDGVYGTDDDVTNWKE